MGEEVCLSAEETCCSGVSFDFANAMRLWEEFTVAALAGLEGAVRMASDFDEAMVRRERVGHRDSGRVVMEHHQLLEGGTEALRLSIHQQWSCWKERRGTCLRAAFHPLPLTEWRKSRYVRARTNSNALYRPLDSIYFEKKLYINPIDFAND